MDESFPIQPSRLSQKREEKIYCTMVSIPIDTLVSGLRDDSVRRRGWRGTRGSLLRTRYAQALRGHEAKTIRSRDARSRAGPLASGRCLRDRTAQPSIGGAAMAAKPIVFVVDGDDSARESVALLIDRSGWQPRTFASAKEFLAQCGVIAPRCMVLDVALPGLKGLDLQTLVADRIDMPVIILTGRGDVEMTVQAMKAGATEFLTKPFRPDVLVGAIAD